MRSNEVLYSSLHRDIFKRDKCRWSLEERVRRMANLQLLRWLIVQKSKKEFFRKYSL